MNKISERFNRIQFKRRLKSGLLLKIFTANMAWVIQLFYKWGEKYRGIEMSDIKRLRELEREIMSFNRCLRAKSKISATERNHKKAIAVAYKIH